MKNGKFTSYERIGFFATVFARKELEGNFARAVGVLLIFAGGLFVILSLKLFQVL